MKCILIMLTVLIICGCATTPYGNYLDVQNVDQHKLAKEAARQVKLIYAPAKFVLALRHDATDPFGKSFVTALRSIGYGIEEYTPPISSGITDAFESDQNTKLVAPMPDATQKLPLAYLLDKISDQNFYRLSITVGSKSISRPYVEEDGILYPIGAWVRRE